MDNAMTGSAVIEKLVSWGSDQPLVRAMLLTSTRAVPGAVVDVFSDYDVILALQDVRPFHEDRGWLAAFGQVLVMYRDPLMFDSGFPKSANVTQFESGLKIDFNLWAVEILQRIASDPHLPPELDAGYKVLLDKDGLTVGLQPPTYAGYLPAPPTEREYLEGIEDFFLVAAYVAKYLRRGDLMAARHLQEAFMLQEHLRPVLEWHYETEHNWSVKPGLYGRHMQTWLRPDLYAGLESTFCGAGLEENWEAMFRAIRLMRVAAGEVGDRLGYAYPLHLEERALAYLHQVMHQDLGSA